MNNVKYTDSINFRCLEHLRETSLDISLIHTGREHCKPYHVFSGVREEYIIHFVLDGSGFFSVNGNTWALTPGQMFLIYPGEAVTYGADEITPWTYAWIGFKECGQTPFSASPDFLQTREFSLLLTQTLLRPVSAKCLTTKL